VEEHVDVQTELPFERGKHTSLWQVVFAVQGWPVSVTVTGWHFASWHLSPGEQVGPTQHTCPAPPHADEPPSVLPASG
jgi:hypothetical protein